MFIVFEGIDGSGKTTLSKKLVKELEFKKIPVVWSREPGGTPLGEKIRDILLNNEMCKESEMFLFAAGRAQHIKDLILPSLKSGKWVILDRFVFSSVVYQGYARGIGWKNVWQINSFAIKNIIPDLVFIVDIPVDLAYERMKQKTKDRLENSKAFLEKVREGFLLLPQWLKDIKFEIINGEKNIDDIMNEIIEKINSMKGAIL